MDIAGNVSTLRQHIHELCQSHQRDPASIQLICVTKTQDAPVLQALADLGLHCFGENRLDHLEHMQQDADESWEFHGIGRVQSRQLKDWVDRCDCLHSLHSISHVDKLARACTDSNKRMPVFVQVNTSGEAQKAGLEPGDLPQMLEACAQHPDAIELRGLMCMAPVRSSDGSNDQVISDCFHRLAQLAEKHGLARLSMGMSGDYDLAIAAGATDIRIGSILFK